MVTQCLLATLALSSFIRIGFSDSGGPSNFPFRRDVCNGVIIGKSVGIEMPQSLQTERTVISKDFVRHP